MFVDRVRVSLRAGNGGAGVAAFERLKGRPKGKPTGGNGGPGGSVILRSDPSVATLLRYQRNPHHAAGNGTHGEGDLRHGKSGEDLVLNVPLGTVVRDDSGTVIADLVEAGQEVVAVRGGRGGLGNAAFVSPANRAPTVAEQGEYGEQAWFTLELKLLADAALIGFPTRVSRPSSPRSPPPNPRSPPTRSRLSSPTWAWSVSTDVSMSSPTSRVLSKVPRRGKAWDTSSSVTPSEPGSWSSSSTRRRPRPTLPKTNSESCGGRSRTIPRSWRDALRSWS
jgi:hypothetical protein